MKKNLFIAVLVLLTFSANIFAGNVSYKDAEKVARNYYYQAYNSVDNFDKLEWNDLILNCITNPEKEKNQLLYIFNVNNNEGYIIVSSHYSISPILAYSFESEFNVGNIAPGQQLFLDYYEESIIYANENNMQASKSASDKWQYYLSYYPEQDFKQKNTVGPLLGPIKWNQSWPYNAMCPPHPDGPSGRTQVGCVATAMLQIMKYYNWPKTGNGSVNHPSSNNGGHGNISINFGNQNYDWTKIPNRASSNYNEELARINYHGGIAVRMNWGPATSGSNTYRILPALRDNFRYSSSITYYERNSNTETAWKNHIRQQMDNKSPIVYAGTSSTGSGHAWNCDGYQGNDHFHMNWGWGGHGDGFYTLENLTSTASAGGSQSNFIYNNRIISNIYPAGTYPEYCSGVKVITGTEGSFEDGSSSSNYRTVTNCTYVINPPCGAIINLNFDKFDLATGDKVEIYNGTQLTDLIATYTSSNPPGNDNIIADKGAMTIKFNSNGNPTASGWDVSYSVSNCKTNIIYTEPSGSFDDGSGACNYSSSSVCTWYIQPEEANYILINFEKFDLGSAGDFVRLYRNSISSANLITTYNRSTPPSQTLHVSSGVVAVQFFADSGEAGQGWKINYESGITDVFENKKHISDFSIIPNPGNYKSLISVELEKSEYANFYIYDLLGKLIGKKAIYLNEGKNYTMINEIVNKDLNNGIYFIKIETENNIYTEKFMYSK